MLFQVMTLAGITLTTLPESFRKLTASTELDISGIHWVDASDNRALLTSEGFEAFMDGHALLAKMPQKVSLL